MPESSRGNEKLQLRAERAAARRRPEPSCARADRDRCAHLLSLGRLLGVHRVAAYWALPGEPDPAGARVSWQREGVAVLLPVLLPGGDLALGPATEPLLTGPYGLQQPALAAGPAAGLARWAGLDLVVVPALAVDRTGTRLGKGGGSYDRALRRADAPVVALLREDELVDRLPVEPHDRPVQAAVLPSGVYWLGR